MVRSSEYSRFGREFVIAFVELLQLGDQALILFLGTNCSKTLSGESSRRAFNEPASGAITFLVKHRIAALVQARALTIYQFFVIDFEK